MPHITSLHLLIRYYKQAKKINEEVLILSGLIQFTIYIYLFNVQIQGTISFVLPQRNKAKK